MNPRLSIIIPTRNDAAALRRTLDHLDTLVGIHDSEVIVAAFGDRVGTEAAVADRARIVWPAQSTRAALMNAGAEGARGEIYFFLHADSFPPADALPLIQRALADGRVVGGAFEHLFDEPAWSLRAITWINRARYRITGNWYGDQGIFVRRQVFERLGGFPARLVFEDLLFSQAMRRTGRTALLRGRCVRTSGRRLLAPDWRRTVALITWLLTLHALGRDTDAHAARYHAPRILGRTP